VLDLADVRARPAVVVRRVPAPLLGRRDAVRGRLLRDRVDVVVRRRGVAEAVARRRVVVERLPVERDAARERDPRRVELDVLPRVLRRLDVPTREPLRTRRVPVDEPLRVVLRDPERVVAARCERWPCWPCCFMTVRAATSFARLP
jgi:hypothetical protein